MRAVCLAIKKKKRKVMSLSTQKQTIRKSILAAREDLSAAERLAASLAITERILAMPDYLNATTVLGYMNFGSEFASGLFVRRALADGKWLVLPRVNRHSNELDLYRVEDLENQLQQGSWGIAEPLPERCERLTELNAVEFALLPGVAFARDGARLGYGGGYYDKLMMKQPAIRLGEQTALAKSPVMARMKPHPVLVAAAYALQMVRDIPQEVTDVKVEWIVTEHEIINCSA